MMARHDHQALLMGSVLSRIDRFEDEELCWQRIDSLTLHRNFRFDWHTHTSSIENAGPQQVHGEYLAGIWQVFGIGSGPYFLQLGTDAGDMFSFAIRRTEAGEYVLNKKIWSFQKTGVLRVAA
ncbi:MAG: hypothetical protein RLZZ331_1141 [Pseudomonadota bacterium]|jgi:hypothetical protein